MIKELKFVRESLHDITDIKELPLDPVEYSKFKYGDTEIAYKYGGELAYFFYSELFPKIREETKKIVIYSSPYSYIPTASYFLTNGFTQVLRNLLIDDEVFDIYLKSGKIQRCNTYSEDYGAMSAIERLSLIAKDTYRFFDRPLEDEYCIFIDDISITGTHQFVVEDLMDSNKMKNKCIFLYYAKLTNKVISPSFENSLNYAYVDSLDKLIDVVLSRGFKLTTRTAKRILQLEVIDFDELIKRVSTENPIFLRDLFYSAIQNDYNQIESYKNNLDKLKYFM